MQRQHRVGVLRPDAQYLGLPKPDYSPHPYGVRPGTAPALAVAGGFLLAVAPFGAWYRVTAIAGDSTDVVDERLGWNTSAVPLLLVAGIAMVLLGRRWPSAGRDQHLVTSVVAVTAAVGTVLLLIALQGDVADGGRAAIAAASRQDTTVGVGWGAWSALVGAAALVLATVFAALARSERQEGTV